MADDSVDEELARAIALSLEISDNESKEQPEEGDKAATLSVLKESKEPVVPKKDPSSLPAVLPAPSSSQKPPKPSEPPTASTESSSTVFPNLECMQMLVSMGISNNASLRGLYHTGNSSADLAAAWVFEHLEDPDLHAPFKPPEKPAVSDLVKATFLSKDFKMVFVVNTSLQMGLGKTSAQVGHAMLALYKTLLLNSSQVGDLDIWEAQGAKKIVVKGRDENELLRLRTSANEKSVVNVVIRDAGLTQVPSGSVTVLALFGSEHKVNEITGNLSLL